MMDNDTEYILCRMCGLRGLPVGGMVCVLCDNNVEHVNKKAKFQVEKVTEPPPVESNMEEENVELYENYNSMTNVYDLPKHPTQLVESSLLAAIPLPEYDVHLHKDGIRRSKTVSRVQGETIMLILTKLNEFFTYDSKPTRKGFFLGDGTGCGKGRVIAGLVQELLLTHNQTKALWMSVSQDLENDSKRDLCDVNCGLNTMNLLNKTFDDTGVMFSTYNTLVKPKRFCDLCEWLGDDYEGLILFDESHKAKQCFQNKKSKTAQRVIELQERYPKARVVYISATGCSQVEHMGYMIRLNLWGTGSLHEDFKDFVNTTNAGESIANEMIAMYLKKKGMYISRSLSYKKVSTGVSVVKTENYTPLYTTCVNIIDKIRKTGLIQGKLKTMFGSSMLRFFRSMLLSFKMEQTIAMIKQCLRDDLSVVVTIQSTWETHQTQDVNDFDAPKTTLLKFLEYMQSIYEVFPKERQMCLDIIEEVDKMKLGGNLNVIDTIIDTFGEELVAEITGRKTYISNNSVVHRRLSNNEEKELFVTDQKRICVISEAGSIGISLHDVTGKHRRFHIILELPWSAEQFMQQCGRTHRSGQSSAPHYQLIMTDLPSERRFLSIILKRLRTLGALTNGNRFIKTDMFDFGDDYESADGEAAVVMLLESGILDEATMDVFGVNCDKVSRFFNRMMMLHINKQEDVFKQFHTLYLKCCNDTISRHSKTEIKNVYVSSIVNVKDIEISPNVTVKTLDVAAESSSYDSIFEGQNIKNKKVMWLVKENNRTFGVAIQTHPQSDLFKLYQSNSIKEPVVTMEYIQMTYKLYAKSTDEFKMAWDKAVVTRTEKLTFVTGSLYEIRIALNKHKNARNARLKKVTCVGKETVYKPILGFHISESMVVLLKQILNKV